MTREQGRRRSNYIRAVLCSPNKKKRKQRSEESMIRALDAVKEGILVNHANELYCVPRSTLQDRVTGNVDRGRYIQSLGLHYILQMLKKQSWLTF